MTDEHPDARRERRLAEARAQRGTAERAEMVAALQQEQAAERRKAASNRSGRRTPENSPDMTIQLPRCDEIKALAAISRLRESLRGAVTMADELERAVRAHRISADLLARHTKWCHTGGSWAAGIDPACDAARAMYGFVPERLVDSENRPGDGYATKLADLKHRIESV